MTIITVSNGCGFFSCSSVRLHKIIEYFNANKKLPDVVDCTGNYTLYKRPGDKDITFHFFEEYSKKSSILYKSVIDYKHNYQYIKYKNINYTDIQPFIKRYFEPTKEIKTIMTTLLKKYSIQPENCIGLYYRGTDKKIELEPDSYESFYIKLEEVIQKSNNPNIQILIQTDATQCLEYMKSRLQNRNVIIIKENATSTTAIGIHNENTNVQNYLAIQFFLATILILAKCKYIICSTSNCSIWTMLFRGNTENVFQNFKKSWVA